MRAFLFLLIAAVLFMAGLGAAVTSKRALKDDDIVSMGRRHTRLIEREMRPGYLGVGRLVRDEVNRLAKSRRALPAPSTRPMRDIVPA